MVIETKGIDNMLDLNKYFSFLVTFSIVPTWLNSIFKQLGKMYKNKTKFDS